MAIGAKQKSLEELRQLLGPQPAAYNGGNYGRGGKGRGLRQLRADRQRVGLHPIGIADIDPDKLADGACCGNCRFRVPRVYATKKWYVCWLAESRVDHRTSYTSKAHQVRRTDPPCTKYEAKGAVSVSSPSDEAGVSGDADTGH